MGISIEMFKFYEVGGKIRDELLGLTTLIKDFDGEINYYVDDDAHIIGVGNVNFFTTQTGF